MAKHVIELLGSPLVMNEDANVAAEAITPGQLIAYNGSGNLIKHATAGGNAARDFALGREELGREIDTAYASGDAVKVGSFCQGMRLNALIGSGVNVIRGDFLESAGNGNLRKLASGIPLAQACEAKNVTVLTRIIVKIV